ncbi:MAG: glutamate synthase large subunit, partial [Candidatus Omnitrophota bacterium]
MSRQSISENPGLYRREFEHSSCGVGFVCNIDGKKTNSVIGQSLHVLKRLAHRGATGADPKTGDGAGVLIQTPYEFFSKVGAEARIKLPKEGGYATGLVFLPVNKAERRFCKQVFAQVIKEEGQILLGWREVPIDNSDIGKTAKETEPVIEQPFIAAGTKNNSFEVSLYIIRKRVENLIRASDLKQKSFFYITNLSSRTFAYKGLLMPEQLEKFFLDLQDPNLKSAITLVHSRYSTNTFPTWDLAQPFRFLAHNGEINTLRGNINWMRAREGLLENKKILPIIVPGGSDSAALDNILELLVLSGRPLSLAMSMLIPAAWEQNNLLDGKIRDFYKFHACLQEPWDGPAAIAFTDGTMVGAVLDRNGLRPCRYLLTKNKQVIMASEVGVLDIPAEEILQSGRLEPGKMFFIDTKAGRIIEDEELKNRLSSRHPYSTWIKNNLLELENLPPAKPQKENLGETLTLLKAFGYTREDLKMSLKPMSESGQEPVGSMGDDKPHAVLSQRPQLLYRYFKQLFAQVTNPAIDPIREELVMSLYSYLGPEKNLLAETALHCRRILVKKPILSNLELEKLKSLRVRGFKVKTISLLFKADQELNLLSRLERICVEAELAIKAGCNLIILSDRGADRQNAALPALLAVGAVHHHLVRRALRNQLSIILETAEPREVHHFALLFGYGADCVNPYLAFAAVRQLVKEKEVSWDFATAEHNYLKAVEKGILKILSKMGISTLQSYKGAQIFEAIGLGEEVISRCFDGTASRIGGVSLNIIAQETILRHKEAFKQCPSATVLLSTGGVYQWKKGAEFHLWNPDSIAALQDAVWNEDYAKFLEFCRFIDDQSQNPTTLRRVLKFNPRTPIAVQEVEPVEDIVRRFATGAMSFGSISKEAHETIAIAMNRLKGKSNTGEGGEDPARFSPSPNGDSTRSAIKQVASGRFGVNTNYLVNADEIQIKIAQGAKPGEGGQLPGHKVSAIIARTRFTTPGVTLISPPPHHDIYSIEDLAQLIFDLKNVNPKARISVKLVSEIGVGTIAAGVAKGHADMILISGADGGTGASPLSSIHNAGLPWELGLAETHQTLVMNDLRSRVRLQTDGGMRTGRDVAIAALLGAEEFGFCTAVLVVLGCVMLRHCHLNNCSVGVATQDEVLRKRFRGRPEYIETYFRFIARQLREIMASLGVRTLDEMIGRTDLLTVNQKILPWKAKALDFSALLYRPKVAATVKTRCVIAQDHRLDGILDRKLIARAKLALAEGRTVRLEMPIKNTDRTTGAMLSGQLCQQHGEAGLPVDTIF